MLTVDYDLLDLRAGMTVLDLGCGEGRHAFEAFRRGASVVAVDWGQAEVETTKRWLGAIAEAGEAAPGAHAEVVRGDLLHLPVPDASVDRVIASEVLEHIPDDVTAMAEIARVLKPGGRVVIFDIRHADEYAKTLQECGCEARMDRSWKSKLVTVWTFSSLAPGIAAGAKPLVSS